MSENLDKEPGFLLTVAILLPFIVFGETVLLLERAKKRLLRGSPERS